MPNRIWQEVSIPNQQGLLLSGIHYSRPDTPGPTLIICHGFTGSKEGGDRVLQMSEYLARELDLDCLTFDFAGHGQSQGNLQDMSLSGQIQDLESVINWCQEHKGGFVLCMGRSFGGCTVICQAARDSRVRAVCSWAAPADPFGLLQGMVVEQDQEQGLVTLGSEEGRASLRQEFFQDLAKFDVPGQAARISPRALLLLHGEEDEVVPVHDAKKIYERAMEPKELYIIPGADHRFSQAYKQVWQICAKWLRAQLI
ncbi:MAG: alpha/beta hydrolase [Desulfohalobiaceae bacterium]